MKKKKFTPKYNKMKKLIVIGKYDPGKTSLIQRYVNNLFRENEPLTTIPDCFVYLFDFFGEKITIRIWDTSGIERFASLNDRYIRVSDIVILTYSVDDRKSFEKIQNFWFPQAKEVCGKNGKEDGKNMCI